MELRVSYGASLDYKASGPQRTVSIALQIPCTAPDKPATLYCNNLASRNLRHQDNIVYLHN